MHHYLDAHDIIGHCFIPLYPWMNTVPLMGRETENKSKKWGEFQGYRARTIADNLFFSKFL